MGKYAVSITSGLISALFILLTRWISLSNPLSVLYEFTSIFHVIPFIIAFAEGASIWIPVYYFILWMGLYFLFKPIVKAYDSSKNKKRFVTLSVAPVVLLVLIALSVDHTRDRNREERIAERIVCEKKEFGHLKTGDLLFNLGASAGNDTSYYGNLPVNNIGIVFIDEDNFAVLQTTDRVGYSSISQWVEKGYEHGYIAKRLTNPDNLLTASSAQKLRKVAQTYIWKETETIPRWSDDKMYNSELVWKIYQQSLNVQLGELDTIITYDVLEYRITLNAILNSDNLQTVLRN